MKEKNQIYIVKCIYQFFLNGFIIKKCFLNQRVSIQEDTGLWNANKEEGSH